MHSPAVTALFLAAFRVLREKWITLIRHLGH